MNDIIKNIISDLHITINGLEKISEVDSFNQPTADYFTVCQKNLKNTKIIIDNLIGILNSYNKEVADLSNFVSEAKSVWDSK